MPSPIAHVAAGYVIYRLFWRRLARAENSEPEDEANVQNRYSCESERARVAAPSLKRKKDTGSPLWGVRGAVVPDTLGILVITVGLSLAPDLDSVVGLAVGDLGRFHNNVTHSLLVGLGVALGVGGLAAMRRRRSVAGNWLLLALLCYDLHVVMDFFTAGRGVLALWPLSQDRYLASATLFVGLHWSEGLWSVEHLWTAATELGLILLVALSLAALGRGKGHHNTQRPMND